MEACSESYVFIILLNQEYLLEMLSNEPAYVAVSACHGNPKPGATDLIVPAEYLSVLPKLGIAVPVDQPNPSMLA